LLPVPKVMNLAAKARFPDLALCLRSRYYLGIQTHHKSLNLSPRYANAKK
jgi:hypothetical protein